MSLLKEVSINIPKTADNDPRIGQLIESNLGKNDTPRAVIIGFPSDKGVTINGGRAGAADAPEVIRELLYKLTPNPDNYSTFVDLIGATKDIGDINIRYEVEEDQRNLGKVVARCLEQGTIPIILGGGHETAFGHFLGYAEAGLKTAIFNLDAHTDVRPLKDGQAHSGSPFRQAIEHENDCEMYLVAGLQPQSVAQSHLQYIKESGGEYMLRDETNITSISGLFHQHESERLMVTFDMDAVDQSQAPGVSAPCVNGLPSDLWLTAAYLAGRNEQVTSFDLSEVNPRHDRDTQTAKLAAVTIWNFLLGLSERE
ncbi:formimidoylglutamase [Fodinibius sp.]|uniref:formimidoylglutamase n=1 Tax=Fodinibius sp. TaxID=1872440 RepID=UPI002ACE8E7A|nr:formimidoylglutamase [Fodinibius sp.]MDZ7659839.1 formimidoylglutamase [Fodinibius sp.]